MRQQSVRQYPGAFMALVVGIAVIALGMARLAAAQNVCFAVCDQCESDSSQDRCTSTPYPRKYVLTQACARACLFMCVCVRVWGSGEREDKRYESSASRMWLCH